MGACSSACTGKVGASAPAVQPEARANAAAETIMQPVEAARDLPEDAKRAVEVAGQAACEAFDGAKEVVGDSVAVQQGAYVGGSCGSWCTFALAVQPRAKADAAAESASMQPAEAARDRPGDAEGAAEVAGDAACEALDVAREVVADDAPALDGEDSSERWAWCCQCQRAA